MDRWSGHASASSPLSPMPVVCRVIHRVVLRKELHQIVMIHFGGHLNRIEFGHTADVSGNRASGVCVGPRRRSCGLLDDRQKKMGTSIQRRARCTRIKSRARFSKHISNRS